MHRPRYGEGREARRELFDTVLRHGSEERLSTPGSVEGEDLMPPHAPTSADPVASHVLTVNTGDRRPESTAASDTVGLLENAWTNAPITAWSHQVTVEFLGYYKIKSEGMKIALSLK